MTLYLADDLYLIAHAADSGKAELPEGLLGISAATALLTELVVVGAAVVEDGWTAPGPSGPPPDRLAEAIHQQLLTQHGGGVPIAEWIGSNRRRVTDLIADRLVRGGYAERELSRRLGRSSQRIIPTAAADSFMRTQRLGSYLRNRLEVTEYDVYLAGLVVSVDGGAAHLELREGDEAHLNDLIGLLRPVLQHLLAHTGSAIDAYLRNPRAGS